MASDRFPHGGNQGLLNVALAEILCDMASAGMSMTACANAAHVSRRAIYDWLKRGEKDIERYGAPTTIYGHLYINFNAARANVEKKMVDTVVSIASNEEAEDRDRLKAATWYLEKARSREYGGTQRIEVGTADEEQTDWAAVIAERVARVADASGQDQSDPE